MIRSALVLIAALGLAGCGSGLFNVGGRDADGGRLVQAKEPPATLVSVDGYVCVVGPVRYNGVEPGDRVWCEWTRRGSR